MTVNVNGGSHWVAVDEAKSLATGQVYIMDSLGGAQNTDLTLASRYASFNAIHAYTGGSTPSGGTVTPDPDPGLSVKETITCKRTIKLPERVVNLYSNPTDTTRLTYFDYGPTVYSSRYAVMSDGSIMYEVGANHQGQDIKAWLKYESDMTVTKQHTYGSTQYESAHPHRGYRVCECGDKTYTGETTTRDDCSECGGEVKYAVEGGYLTFDKKTGTVTDCDSSVTKANIPHTIKGVAVKSIGANAFNNQQHLESVTIPDGVTSIGERAFCSSGVLTSVKIPDSVTSIGAYAFDTCSSLTNVTIPNGVTSIEEHTFDSCISLTSVTIPDSVTSIGDWAFSHCTSLTSVTIPDSVTSINWYAFYNCKSLTDVYYAGSEAQWKAISISSTGNDDLLNANIHYNYVSHTHSYKDVVTAPTCTEKGYTTHTCSCGDSYVDTYVDALGHAWDNGKVTKQPTETETGVKTYTCTRCSATKTETIPKLTHEHNYNAVVTAPTCTEKGYTTHTCACGDSYVDSYVLPLGHDWGSGKVTKEPTATENGIKTYICARCGETKTETIPKLTHEHSYKAVVTAPTCTEKGYTTHTCACGDSYVDAYTDALGHAWDNGKVTKEPTETETGVKTFTCTRCGETKTETIPATGVMDVTKMFTDVSHSWADDGIQYCVTHQLMSGIGNDLFGPKLTTTRAQIVQILYNLEGEPKVSGTTPFTDLTNDWYQDAVLWAYQTGVVAGTSSTTFEPDLPVTREQIAVILMEYMTRVLKLERTWTPADLSIFPDADSVSDWAKDAMADAVGLGLISGASNGGQTLLEPQGSATREQVATILMEFCKNVKK